MKREEYVKYIQYPQKTSIAYAIIPSLILKKGKNSEIACQARVSEFSLFFIRCVLNTFFVIEQIFFISVIGTC